jgi:hypothetical protein
MEPSTSDSDEYEEIVVVSLSGVLDTDTIYKAVNSGNVRLRTIDSEEPIIQVHHYFCLKGI